MTYKEIATMISSIGLPYAYYQFPDGTEQSPPFICFFYASNDDFIADGTNYATIVELIVELYTDNKDFANEAAVEAVLNANGLVFRKDEEYIDSEKMYQISYSAQVIIDKETSVNG